MSVCLSVCHLLCVCICLSVGANQAYCRQSAGGTSIPPGQLASAHRAQPGANRHQPAVPAQPITKQSRPRPLAPHRIASHRRAPQSATRCPALRVLEPTRATLRVCTGRASSQSGLPSGLTIMTPRTNDLQCASDCAKTTLQAEHSSSVEARSARRRTMPFMSAAMGWKRLH